MLSTTNRSRMTVAAAVVLASLIVVAPVLAASVMSVQKVTVNCNVVQVTVKNMSNAPASGKVLVQAVVNGSLTSSYMPISLAAGQCGTVGVGFSGPVGSVQSTAIYDDGQPF